MRSKALDVDPETFGAELVAASQQLVQRIGTTAIVIVSVAELEQAVLDRETIGATIKRTELSCAHPIKLAHELHTDLLARRNSILHPLQALDRMLAGAIRDFKQRADREREQRERDAAEQQRRDTQARAASEAAALEAAGQHALAAAVVDEAIARPAPAVALPDVTKEIPGLKFRRRWLWRYAGGPQAVDATPAPIRARTLAIIPREFLMIDEARLGQYARAMKDAARVEGVEFYAVDEPVR